MQSQPYDVAVIGGGLAGLTAATYLARAGISVTVFERAATLGGNASTQVFDGFHLNRGIYGFYLGGALESVLKELGVTYSGGNPKNIAALRAGKLYVDPVDPLTLLRTGLLDLGDKLELLRWFVALPGLKAQDQRWTTVQAWIDTTLHRPRVRQLMRATACTLVYSSALDLVSAEVLIDKLQLLFKHPIVYVDGGWQMLVEGLRHAAENAGARIVTGRCVESVEVEQGQVFGVRLRGGEHMPANAAVVATTPQAAAKLVDDARLRTAVDALIPAPTACLDVLLSRLPDPGHPVVQDVDGPRFMSSQSLFSRVAPDGGAIVYTIKQLDPSRPSDPRANERELEAFLDSAQPGWRDVLVKRVFLPSIDAVGALPTAKSGGFAGRPGVQVAGIDGLYLAGDWVGGEGFLSDASAASARKVAQQIAAQPLTHEQPMRVTA